VAAAAAAPPTTSSHSAFPPPFPSHPLNSPPPPRFFGGGFGGFGGFGGQQEEPESPKGKTVVVELQVTLRDLYLGRTFPVTRDRAVYKPSQGTRKCRCTTRMHTRQVAPGMYQQYPSQSCESCPAVRLVREAEKLQVEVERGSRDGHEVSFFEQGEPMLDGEPGDLRFKIVTVEAADVPFTRRGDDLHVEYSVTLVEALVGFQRELVHLDGHKVALVREGVTRPGEVQALAGEGMPVFGQHKQAGRLVVTYSVAMPQTLDEKQKAGVRELFKKASFA